jgi:aspartyl-tRNA(Asn)/glutamyl-tRNA(Gln) amidotransferase subunit A
MSAIADLTCADLTAAYRRGALSPLDVARDCLARIAVNAAINAFLQIEPAAVLAAAAESEARWRAGSPLGPIDGVPASIKDNIWVMGLPTRRGSKTSDASPVQTDSPAVARLREQGSVILGKTCMPEHGWIGVCHSPLTGITRNPAIISPPIPRAPSCTPPCCASISATICCSRRSCRSPR